MVAPHLSANRTPLLHLMPPIADFWDGHFIMAEQPGIVADRAAHLLDRASRTGAPSLP